ncbi:hypothetical protein NLG97_g378 [Lecanicillium saksenae]|uniref:Uncharacterized protein n=1 Tax=Lecanicillium saksenae TaxID=468837 RepID=A0ACC1R8N9_9HYPO|nr:hypothetical protein NLG97_g378 [Lecanicillium saksenae]
MQRNQDLATASGHTSSSSSSSSSSSNSLGANVNANDDTCSRTTAGARGHHGLSSSSTAGHGLQLCSHHYTHAYRHPLPFHPVHSTPLNLPLPNHVPLADASSSTSSSASTSCIISCIGRPVPHPAPDYSVKLPPLASRDNSRTLPSLSTITGLLHHRRIRNCSSHFKTGAEYVEGYLTYLAKTVNRTALGTGVKGGVRWFSCGQRHWAPASEPKAATISRKRLKVGKKGGHDAKDGTGSGDTLSTNDELRSRAGSETAGLAASQTQAASQTHCFRSTSGLRLTMSSEELRSLKYCLKWLHWTNGRIKKLTGLLKNALMEWESSCNTHVRLAEGRGDDKDQAMQSTKGRSGTTDAKQGRIQIANHIQVLKTYILTSLQQVVTTVSKYGGALPGNARILIRRHLTSLPQRFRLATMNENPNNANGDTNKDKSFALGKDTQMVLVLAKEGLDMVTQITSVLQGTIVSAEQWCVTWG